MQTKITILKVYLLNTHPFEYHIYRNCYTIIDLTQVTKSVNTIYNQVNTKYISANISMQGKCIQLVSNRL